jgi:hypothetical protein
MQSGSFLTLLVKIREACQTFFLGGEGGQAQPAEIGQRGGGRGPRIKKTAGRKPAVAAVAIRPGQQGVKKQVSGCQSKRAAFWKAQHIREYVSIYKSRTTTAHGLKRRFSTPC